MGALFRDFIQTDYFRVVVVDDVDTVEVCGALKVCTKLLLSIIVKSILGIYSVGIEAQ
jgi:glycerol-3-phosphate dehydrogenase